MSDKFDQRLREKLGGYETPFEPTDWAALNERLDARETGSNRRIALILFGAILLGSAVLGVLYQTDMRHAALTGESTANVSGADDDIAATPLSESPMAPGNSANATLPAGSETLETSETSAQDAGTDLLTGAKADPGVPSTARSFEAAVIPQTGNRSTADQGPGIPNENPPLASSATAATKEDHPASSGLVIPKSTSSTAAIDAQRAEEQALADQHHRMHLASSPDQGIMLPANPASISAGVNAGINADSRLAALAANPLHPMATIAASHDPFALPQDRSWAPEKRDISLRKTPVRWALAAGPGLNTALTAFGDGFRPAWDIGVAGEAWFGSGAFVSAGLRYGVYRFQQSDVACGDHAAHGLSDAVHCPDAMLGDESLWEIPLQAGYGMDLKKVNGRFRVFGGLSARISRKADYHVEFHGVSAGDTLFFDPVVINVASSATAGYPENYTYDANDLQDMTSITTGTSSTSNEEQGSRLNRTSLAVELGFGYEQFLAPTVSLGIQPRLDIPLNRLPMGEGRAYHLGMNAMLRWYPNWSR